MKIILIDNYDSFTFNLYHYLSSFAKVDVLRNDKVDHHQIIKNKYNKIVISPGPGNPNQSGNCLKIVKNLYKTIPILGVCLGHQIIGQIFGSKIVQAKELIHGKTSNIINMKVGILNNLPKVFSATRYHSLIIDRKSLDAKIFFRIIDGDKIDGTTETDGIDVTSIKTSKFPNGFFIAQDDDNDGLNQNFKLVDWNKILK